MGDSQGLCIRFRSFSHDHSRVSRWKRALSAGCYEINNSEMNHEPCRYPWFSLDNEFNSLSSSFRPDLTENTSASWLGVTGKLILRGHLRYGTDSILAYLKRLQQYQLSDLPKRSRSCDGRIEASSVYALRHIQKPVLSCTGRFKTSQSSSFLQPRPGRQPKQSGDDEIQDFFPPERLDRSAKEKKDKDTLIENYALADRIDKSDLDTRRKTSSGKATILPQHVLIQKASKASISPAALCTVPKKRSFEDDGEAVPFVPIFKKPAGCTKLPKRPNENQSTTKNLGIEGFNMTVKLSPSSSQPSGK